MHWWSWAVQFFAALATFLAVLLALFGEKIKATLFKPQLELSLVAERGESTVGTAVAPDGATTSDAMRMYHLRVRNAKEWPLATQVQVLLVRLEEFGPDGSPQVKWTGDVPMRWRHQEIYPLSRTIGAQADCDLLSVVKAKGLLLHPVIAPNNLPTTYARKVDLIVSLQARSNEASSQMLSLRVSWDGEWNDGEVEMARHLLVGPIDRSS